MSNGVKYDLMIEGKEKFHGFTFQTKNEAMDCFDYLLGKFEDVKVNKCNLFELKEKNELVIVSVNQVITGSSDFGIADYTPEEYFSDIYEKLVEEANAYFRNTLI